MLDRVALLLRMLPALPKLAGYRPSSRTTVADRLEAQAERRPDDTFVLFEGRRLSYREANAQANRTARWARDLSLAQGDVVALLMENRPEYVTTWAGLAKLGVITALINTNLTGRALAHALDTSEARHVVLGSECADRLETAAPHLVARPQIWVMADPGHEPSAALPAGFRDLDAALAELPDTNTDASERDGLRSGDELFYIYTSGTTGLPKAARFSHMRFLGIGDLSAWALGLRPGDVHYCALPLYHSAGGVMVVSAVLTAGASLALRRRFSASAFWDDIRRFEATHFQYIGEFCRYLINQPPRENDADHRVRAVIGNGLRADIWPGFTERFGIDSVVEFYGATEGNVALVNLENKVGSVGRFPLDRLSNAKLIRFDVEADTHPRREDGFCVECEQGEVGELLGRIPARDDTATGRFEGYTSKEATDKKVLHGVFEAGDAWFRSGDLLRRDADGFYYFVDRIGDTYRWKGENVSTQEVGEILTGFPGFEMVNVYGVEVEGHDGRAGMAAVVTGRDAFDPERFYSFVTEALPRYAAPLFVRLLAEQDVTGTFKIRKVDLQREGLEVTKIEDPILIRDEASRSYCPLTPELLAALRSGALKL